MAVEEHQDILPVYVSPQALQARELEAWLTDNAGASAEETLKAVKQIGANVNLGEYVDEVSGERLVWIQDAQEDALSELVSRAGSIHERHVAPIRNSSDAAGHRQARDAVQQEQRAEGCDAQTIHDELQDAGTGHWEFYDPEKHGGDYRPQPTVDQDGITVSKDGGATSGGGTE